MDDVRAELVRFKANSKVFSLMDDAGLDRLATACLQHNFAAGETIIREGDVGSTFFFIVAGGVRVMIDGLGSPLVHSTQRIGSSKPVQIMVRPEKIGLSLSRPLSNDRVNTFPGVIEDVAYFGSHTRCRVRAGDFLVSVQMQRSRLSGGGIEPTRGNAVWLSFHPDEARVVVLGEQA